jgi:hypothetical protein
LTIGKSREYFEAHRDKPETRRIDMKDKKKKKNTRKKNLKIRELEKKVVPSPFASKKPPVPPPYTPGTLYGLAKRRNIS